MNEQDKANSTFLTDVTPHGQAAPSQALPFVPQQGKPAPVGFVPFVEISADDDTVAENLACGSLAWRQANHWRLMVVVKASLDMRHSPMKLVSPQALATQDRHHRGNPMAHVVASNDLVPFRPRADITLSGHACAPEGTTVSELGVRLALRRNDTMLMDKRLQVVGNHRDGVNQPFERIRISYDRAFGGLGCEANPIGCGAAGDPERPNIVVPHAPETPGGFGPTSEGWPERKKQLKDCPKPSMAGASMTLGDSLDWSYFQAAPADQQLAYLHGDETFILEGLSAEHPVLEFALPEVSVAGAVFGVTAYGESTPLEFHLDTLHIDTDAMQCSVAWRAVILVESEGILPGLLAVTGITTDGWQLGLPDERPNAPAPASPLTQRAGSDWQAGSPSPAIQSPSSGAAGSTMGIELNQGIRAPATPFRVTPLPESQPSSTPASSGPPPASSQTMAISVQTLMDSKPPPRQMGGPESGERLTIPSADPAEFTKPATADSQAVPFENASTSSVRPAASDYDGAASAMGGSTMVVESTDELEARIAAIEAEKALALKAEAEREAEDERRRAEDKEQRAAAKAAEDRRAEESRRFAEEQAAAHAREERKKSEEEASKKKAGLDFRRHARRGFKRDNES